MTRPVTETHPETAGNREWLWQRYVEEDRTLQEVADLIGCSQPAARLALVKNGIAIRTLSETKVGRPSRTTWTPEMREAMAAKRRGPKNPMHGKPSPARRDWDGPVLPLEEYKDAVRLKKYGLTPEQYAALVARQNGVCAICKREETVFGKGGRRLRRISIDHCHDTGKVRGLLCQSCNLVVGQAKNDPAILRSAADYLERC